MDTYFRQSSISFVPFWASSIGVYCNSSFGLKRALHFCLLRPPFFGDLQAISFEINRAIFIVLPILICHFIISHIAQGCQLSRVNGYHGSMSMSVEVMN